MTLNLTVYTEDPPLVQVYTLSNTGVYLQVYNISLLPPLHPAVSIALSRQPLFLLEESGTATITLTVNSSLLLPFLLPRLHLHQLQRQRPDTHAAHQRLRVLPAAAGC